MLTIKTLQSKPAKGTRGLLLRTFAENKHGEVVAVYKFRIYAADNSFIDYDICHYDMEIEILEDDAVFLTDGKGNHWLDHSMEYVDESVDK